MSSLRSIQSSIHTSKRMSPFLRNALKFTNGLIAREKWAKNLSIANELSIDDFNKECNDVFCKEATIQLDPSERQTVIEAIPLDKTEWNKNCEKIYIITKNKKILKIGGTRNGMKERFGSYLCGHHVCERGKSGKMSVTNAHLYHTIEKDLLETECEWEFYTWALPVIDCTVDILGTETKINVQTYHAYESCCINKYKNLTGHIPILCDNCDPSYK